MKTIKSYVRETLTALIESESGLGLIVGMLDDQHLRAELLAHMVYITKVKQNLSKLYPNLYTTRPTLEPVQSIALNRDSG